MAAYLKEKSYYWTSLIIGIFPLICSVLYFMFHYDNLIIRIGVTMMFVWMGFQIWNLHKYTKEHGNGEAAP